MTVPESGNEGFWIAIRESSWREKWDPNWGRCVKDLWFIHEPHHHTWAIFPIYSKKGKIRRHYTTLGQFFFSWAKKLEDKPEIKRGLPLSRMWWKNRRLDQTNQRLRKCRPTKWSRASDRPTRWANDQEHVVSTEKTRKVKKQPRSVSWLNLITHWGKFFKRGFEKFWRRSGSTLGQLSRSRAKGTKAEI